MSELSISPEGRESGMMLEGRWGRMVEEATAADAHVVEEAYTRQSNRLWEVDETRTRQSRKSMESRESTAPGDRWTQAQFPQSKALW